MMNLELFHENMTEFKNRLPKNIWEKINKNHDISKYINGAIDTGDLNVDFGQGPIYEKNALAFVTAQVEEYCKNPVRYFMPQWQSREDKPFHHTCLQRNLNIFSDRYKLNKTQSGRCGYLASFGLCTGLHLLLLFQKLDFKNLIIIEPKIEFIALSMHLIQWKGFLRLIEFRGGRIEFICSEDPVMASNLLLAELRGPDFSMLDGTYLYQHYESAYLDQFIDNFNQTLTTLPNSMGFVEDEYLMIKHALLNLKDDKEYIFLNSDIVKKRQIPVIIVGSGPSIDTTIKDIKRNKDKAIIISGGTGLSVLLKHGLTPDFHCEIENVPDIYQALNRLNQNEKLSQLTLIAPTTIDPRVSNLFKQTIFYNRDSVVPTRFLSTSEEAVHLAGPTVTNLACRFGISMGFSEFLLCGIDLGSVQKKTHHSKSSIYGTDKSKYWKTGAGIADFNIKIPGNRHKFIYTNRSLLLARMYFEHLLSICEGQKFYNLSNGALIKNTETLDSKKINLSLPFKSKTDHIEDILARLPRKNSKDIDLLNKVTLFKEQLNVWYQRIFEIIDDPKLSTLDLFYDKIRPLLQQGQHDNEQTIEAATRAMASGSLVIMLQSVFWTIRRLNPDFQPELLKEFKRLLVIELSEMQNETNSIIQQSIE